MHAPDKHKKTHSVNPKISECEIQQLALLFPSAEGLEARLRWLWSVTLLALEQEKRFCFPEAPNSPYLRATRKVRVSETLYADLERYAASCGKELSELCTILTGWGIEMLQPLIRADEYRKEELVHFIRQQMSKRMRWKKIQYALIMLLEAVKP